MHADSMDLTFLLSIHTDLIEYGTSGIAFYDAMSGHNILVSSKRLVCPNDVLFDLIRIPFIVRCGLSFLRV